jgi:hypothetical protein
VILAAGLLILAGLGLFVAGILTGGTVLYWGCVAACVVAGVLLIAAWRRMPAKRAAGSPPAATRTSERKATTSASGATKPDNAKPDSAKPETPEPEARESATAQPTPVEEPAPPPAAHDAAPADLPDPGVEEVEVTDLLVIVDLTDEVLVVDEHPRYHVADCTWLAGRETIPLPLDEARTDGFTPCAVCSPDRTLAERARAKKHAGS